MKKLTRREKVLLGVSIVGIGVAGYFGVKYVNLKRAQFNSQQELKNVKEELGFIKFLVIESDCVPRALQNGENKLARKETKIKELVETLQKCPNKKEIKIAIEKHENEAKILREQLIKTLKLNELIENDENIYAK